MSTPISMITNGQKQPQGLPEHPYHIIKYAEVYFYVILGNSNLLWSLIDQGTALTTHNQSTLSQPGIFYGWIIVAASLIVSSVLFGIRFSFGVFFKSLENDFGLTRAATSSVFSLYMIFFAIFAIISGWALDRYGPRRVVSLMGLFTGLSLLITSQANSLWQLFLSYSLLLGIGTGGTMPVLMSVVSRWFEKKRGLAVGLAASGSGLGILVLAPSAAYLISNSSWRMSYIMLGLISLAAVISSAMLLRKDPREIGQLPDGIKSTVMSTRKTHTKVNSQPTGLSLPQALKNRNFWLMLLAWLSFATCMNLVVTHIVAHATDVGIPVLRASTLVSVMGGLNMVGRLATGRLSDIVGRKIPGISCAMLGAVALLWLIWSQQLWMFYVFAILFGFAWGGFGVIIITLVGDVFGRRSLGTIMGTLEMGFSIGAAIGPALGGFVFDITNSYVLAFTSGSILMLFAGILIVLITREI